jgi:hypothetical protein
MRIVVASGLMLVAAAGAAEDPAPVAFRAEAKVELDATGKPTRIEASPDLPAAIRSYIERRVATWTFSPPARGDVTGTGVTYLSLGACAVPADGGYRLGLDFKHNGPRVATPNGRVPPIGFPAAAMRLASEVEADVHFFIESDGRATLKEIDYADRREHRRDGFDETLRDWVDRMRFDPEYLAGQPLRSEATIHVNFLLDGKARSQVRQELLDTALDSRECRAAAGEPDGLTPVVLDSPIKVLKTI